MFNSKKNARKNGLSIIIVGCGKVGLTLASRLSSENHDIAVIDQSADKVEAATSAYDVIGIVGNGASFKVQQEAGIENADILIAVTDSDELNLLCCLVAKRAGRCDVIARVRTPDYSEESEYLQEQLGLAMIINPDQESANAISRILYLPTALDVTPFAGGQAELVRVKLPKDNVIIGKKIYELGQEGFLNEVLISAVERDKKITIPDGLFELQEGDIISFISPVRAGRDFLNRIGFQTNQVRSTLIIGGGRSGYYLAKQLIDDKKHVTIIESKRERCEELSILLPKAVVINGDGISEDLLKEVGIEHVESFVPLTGLDEENILLTLHAREVSDAKVITKINRITLDNVISNLELGSVIYPKYVTADAILRYVRAKTASMNSNIESLYHLFDNRAEAIEFHVGASSRIIGKPLANLPLKQNILVACIHRGDDILIPGGHDMIEADDSVIVVTTNSGYTDIEDILK